MNFMLSICLLVQLISYENGGGARRKFLKTLLKEGLNCGVLAFTVND